MKTSENRGDERSASAAEARLREAQQQSARLAFMLEETPDFVSMARPDGPLVFINRAGRRLVGLAPDVDLTRLTPADFSPPWIVERTAREWLPQALRNGTVTGEGALLAVDGREIPVSFVMLVHRDAAGAVEYISTIARDISDRKAAELAVREREQEFRSIFDLAAVGVAQGDPATGRILRVNPKYCAITGYDAGELVGRSFRDITHPDDWQSDFEAIQRVVRGEDGEWRSEKRYIRKDGVQRWVVVTGRLIPAIDGRPPCTVAIIEDVEDRKRAEDALRQSELALRESEARARAQAAELAALMEAVPAIIFIAHDPFCRVITGSRAAAELLRMPLGANLSKSADVGAPAHFRVFKDGVELAPEDLPVQQAARGFELHGFEEEIRFDDGTSVFLFGNARPLRDEGGAIRGAVSAFVDVTALKRLELALRETDRRKDEFLAMLAHELRNPLAPIRNAVHVLKSIGPPEPQLQGLRDTVERQVLHLARLVDDLLDVSRITQNKVVLQFERLELVTVVGRAVETARPLIDARRQRLVVDLAAEPVRIDGDLTRLAQVIANLLNNAAKYTDEGGSVLLSARPTGGEVLIRVKDDGIGIPGEVLPHVFDLFTQGERSLERAQGGLGIGLTLVRRLVEMHGGRVEAHSDGPGRGSEFRVFLPAARDAAPAESAPPARPAAADHPGRRVLVVDDNIDSAETLAQFLQLKGQTVHTAHSGLAALEVAESFAPDVVLLDIGLPGLDGYEVARRLRARPGGHDMLIVALTGYGRPEDRRQALAAGCDEHFTKPVDLDLLAEVVLAGR